MNPLRTLAQLPIASPESLPAPGGISYWILERSTLTAVLLGVAGLLILFALARRGQFRAGALSGGAGVVLAVAVGITGTLVVTEREHVSEATRLLIDAACTGDTVTVDSLLAPDVQVRVGGQRVAGDGRQILRGATETLQTAVSLSDYAVEDLQREVVGDNAARTQVNVRAVIAGGGPTFSWWMIDWRKGEDGEWRVWGLECVLLNGRRPQPGMLRMFN